MSFYLVNVAFPSGRSLGDDLKPFGSLEPLARFVAGGAEHGTIPLPDMRLWVGVLDLYFIGPKRMALNPRDRNAANCRLARQTRHV